MPAYASPVEVDSPDIDSALALVLAELTQKLEPADVSALASAAKQDQAKSVLDAIATSLTALGGYTDGVEAALTTLAGHVDGLEALATALNGYVDGLEGKDFATQTTLAALLAKVIAAPSTEAKQDAANTLLTAIAGSVDGLEGFTDGLEGLATSLNGYTDGLEAAHAADLAKLEAVRALLAGTLLVESKPGTTDRGYQQLTSTAASATIASLCSGAALPTGATKMLVVPTAVVRFRADATNPSSTVGFPVAASQPWTYDGNALSSLKVYGAATLDCWFFS